MSVGTWQERLAAPAVTAQEMVELILGHAVDGGVSDIHIEPMDDCARVRFRLDGVLFSAGTLPLERLEKVTARIKIMSSLDIANKRLPQDGRLVWKDGKRVVDMRVSTMPTVRGEKTVIRLLNSDAVLLDIDRLGFAGPVVGGMRKLLKNTRGLFLLGGPTGSGKTTTLYAALRELDSPAVSVATLEDPVEYKVNGLCQSQINRKSGLFFLNGLRALLRQDPDILVIGEIRDRETADIAVHAALTGHLVFSTLHAGSAFEAPVRLIDMGIEPYLVADALLGVLSQRLARCLCPVCRKEIPDSEYGTFTHGACEACCHTGYKGRIALGEILPVGAQVRRAIRQCAGAGAIEEAGKADGAWSMAQSIQEALQQGKTDWPEVQRVYND